MTHPASPALLAHDAEPRLQPPVVLRGLARCWRATRSGSPRLFAALWVGSKEFRRLLWHLLRAGWGSDASSGARLAYEAAFVDRVTG